MAWPNIKNTTNIEVQNFIQQYLSEPNITLGQRHNILIHMLAKYDVQCVIHPYPGTFAILNKREGNTLQILDCSSIEQVIKVCIELFKQRNIAYDGPMGIFTGMN